MSGPEFARGLQAYSHCVGRGLASRPASNALFVRSRNTRGFGLLPGALSGFRWTTSSKMGRLSLPISCIGCSANEQAPSAGRWIQHERVAAFLAPPP